MSKIRTPDLDERILWLDAKTGGVEETAGGDENVYYRVGKLRVFVPYTTPELTKAALAAASTLSQRLRASVTLFAVRVVPFPLQIDQPDVSTEWLERKLLAMGQQTTAPAEVRVVLARDRDTGLQQVLEPKSLVVVATAKRWWPTAEARLARSLARAGHSVALVAA